MPLLADYAITPDVFDVASYSTPRECEARLDNLRQVMRTRRAGGCEPLPDAARRRTSHMMACPLLMECHDAG